MVIKETREDRIFNFINTLVLCLIALVCLYPLLFILAASISDPVLVNSGQVLLWPKGLTLEGYLALLTHGNILRGYLNSILYTVGGTLVNLAVTLPAAYALSRKDFVGRSVFAVILLIPMFFSGGLVPTYLLIKDTLHLYNNPLLMFILGATSTTNIIICRTFFQTNIPAELRDAAEIDGCSNTRYFFKIVLPLSGALIAVMALLFGVGHWNSFFTAMIYIRDDAWKPLQLIMREILIQSQIDAELLLAGGGAADSESLLASLQQADLIKYSLIVVASAPVLIAYPFVQKHFVKGITIGALKG